MTVLDDTVVVTVRKSFWASPEADVFPHRVEARVFYGHSTNLLSSVVTTCRALIAIMRRRPRVVVLGSVERAVPWFIRARRLGLLGRARLVVTNQLHLTDDQLEQVDCNLVYSQAWIGQQRPFVQERARFVPLPADGDFEEARRRAGAGGYVFAGGGAGRDFPSLIEAFQGLELPLEIVTFSPETLGWRSPLPDNVRVSWRLSVQAFLERVAAALLVVVPLHEGASDFGQTTLVQALSLGKAVIATRSPSVVDYVVDGREGFLVEAGDVEGYRAAILRLAQDPELRQACETHARERARLSSYSVFAQKLTAACEQVAGVSSSG